MPIPPGFPAIKTYFIVLHVDRICHLPVILSRDGTLIAEGYQATCYLFSLCLLPTDLVNREFSFKFR